MEMDLWKGITDGFRMDSMPQARCSSNRVTTTLMPIAIVSVIRTTHSAFAQAHACWIQMQMDRVIS